MIAAFFLANLLIAGYQETLYPECKQTFSVDALIHQEKTEWGDVAIFENSRFGRILALDGAIQLTEKDEFIYHEMMAHVPLLTHGKAKFVLIVGGGDGGLLREVLRHETVEKIIQVEINPAVIALSKKHLPAISQGAFDNPRARIVIQNAAHYVKETKERFDVILCDSSDPQGPAKALFTSEFYGDCKRILNPNGIFVNQSGVPFMQKNELKTTEENQKPHFKHLQFFVAPVPTYFGGFMAFGCASDKNYKVAEKVLLQRMGQLKGKMRYYTPAIHKASFALPQYMLE